MTAVASAHELAAFDYQVARAALTPELAATFYASAPDAALEQFLSRSRRQRAGSVKTFAFRGLRRVLSDYDAYGLLRMYQLHLLSTEQWCQLLGRGQAPQGALLDVGAGDGGVTGFAKPLFSSIVATESARVLQAALRRQQLRCVDHDLGTAAWPSPERFDVVSVLNVLDRTRNPRTLLRNACAVLHDTGTLVISLPLPIRAHVHVGPDTVEPDEPLPIAQDSFEAGVTAIARELLTPTGLSVRRWTRLPYVSQGDKRMPFYVLDAAVLACAKLSASQRS